MLAAYEAETVQTSEPSRTTPAHTGGLWGALAYALVICTIAWFEITNAFALPWRDAGSASAKLILNGEWWRTLTALCLHGDALHLTGNVLFGALFGVLAARAVGTGLAWFYIVSAGATGNAINAWFSSPAHVSIGASTAVFAALGLIAVVRFRERADSASRIQRLAPIVVGVVLLGTLGLGGNNTDIGAHIAGFFTGAVAGVCHGLLRVQATLSTNQQSALGAATFASVLVAWTAAINAI